MNKKGYDYALIMLFIVIVSIPVLYWRMTAEVEETKETIGESQAILLGAPYAKEDIINYLQKSAETALPDILAKVAENNAFLDIACGGEYEEAGMKCSIISSPTSITNICKPNTLETFTYHFNKELDKYIAAFNAKSYTKIPTNNYDIYIDGNNIHAIATIPVKKGLARKGTELDTIGTMWFAPSVTITADHKLDQYNNDLEILKTIAANCAKGINPKECAETYAPEWTIGISDKTLKFVIQHGNTQKCYALATV